MNTRTKVSAVLAICLLAATVAIASGCASCHPKSSNSLATTKPSSVINFKAVKEGQVPVVALTYCDFCLKPIAAQTKEGLLDLMTNNHWYLTDQNQVVCPSCAMEIGKLGFH